MSVNELDKFHLDHGIFVPKRDVIKPKGTVMLMLFDKNGRIKSKDVIGNLVTNIGRTSLAMALRGDETNTRGIITVCAVGTNSTAPAHADTGLGTELARKLISVRSNVDDVSTFQTFFTTAEANGSLREAGLFGDDASASIPGSGTLFCKLAINRTKTSGDTLTLSWDVEIGR